MLTAKTMDGKTLAEEILGTLESKINEENLDPSLHIILVGNDEPSLRYIRHKKKKADAVGIDTNLHHYPMNVSPSEVREQIRILNNDPGVDGIITQLPLPDELNTVEILSTLDPHKDVDGLHPKNFGQILSESVPNFYPPTPLGIIRLLKDYEVELSGNSMALVGMGRLVGRPLSQMLLNNEATVICLNDQTSNLAKFTRNANVIVAGAGVPGLLQREHVTEDCVVIDTGIHRTEDGLVGDVEFDEVADVARLITPVPGGVGPLTVAYLLSNTVDAAAR